MGSNLPPPRRLPARVYWVRRALVLVLTCAVLAALVWGVSGLFGSGPDKATVAAKEAKAETEAAPVQGPVAVTPKKARRAKPTAAAKQQLAPPSGTCASDDVIVTPVASKATAGGPTYFRLELTSTGAACSFEVSPSTIAAKITSGSDRIWSTQECPAAITRQTVTPRSDTPAVITVGWSGRRSEAKCRPGTDWALPGTYYLHATALGSEPTSARFTMVGPARKVIKKVVPPKPAAKAAATKKQPAKPTASKTPRSPDEIG